MSLFPVFRKKNSGEIARNRLKLLLVADKADCSPEVMQMIKDDMIHVISRYMDVDSDRIETVSYTHLMLDHIIIGDNSYTSFKERGII